jgi:hypothetical protein
MLSNNERRKKMIRTSSTKSQRARTIAEDVTYLRAPANILNELWNAVR